MRYLRRERRQSPRAAIDTKHALAKAAWLRIMMVRRPKATPELERYMRCKDCSQVRGYAYKRSHLVALRTTKITTSDPPSTWWPGER
jgi:hypothetical protein